MGIIKITLLSISPEANDVKGELSGRKWGRDIPIFSMRFTYFSPKSMLIHHLFAENGDLNYGKLILGKNVFLVLKLF